MLFFILGVGLTAVTALDSRVDNAAAWVGALSTFFAAIGTIGSLFMLNRQHNQNVLHQEKVWKKQEESLDFARYREHKAQFEQLLDSLEAKHGEFYVFKDRTRLYVRLFPNNSPRNEFSQFTYKHIKENLPQQHPLSEAWKLIDKVDRIIRTHDMARLVLDSDTKKVELCPNPLPIHQIEHAIFGTARNLGLKCNRHPKTGDLINTDEVFASVFDPLLMRRHSSEIFESLNEFCGLESPRQSGVIYSPLGIGFQLLDYYMRDETPDYNDVLLGQYDIVSILFRLDRLAKLLPDDHQFGKFVREQYGTPWAKALLEQIEDKGVVRRFINGVSDKLRELIEQNLSETITLNASSILTSIKAHSNHLEQINY
nr:hypothetical protein [Vibrio brasiliensis]